MSEARAEALLRATSALLLEMLPARSELLIACRSNREEKGNEEGCPSRSDGCQRVGRKSD